MKRQKKEKKQPPSVHSADELNHPANEQPKPNLARGTSMAHDRAEKSAAARWKRVSIRKQELIKLLTDIYDAHGVTPAQLDQIGRILKRKEKDGNP
jgi:hypothetical protein